MKQSKFLSLGKNDFAKGLIIAVLTAVVIGISNYINSGSFPMDWTSWKPIVLSAISAALAYLTKNFLTSSDDRFLKKEDAK